MVHEDFGVFSYDTNRKRVVWRQFHSESLVNYTLESVSADGKSLEFVTTKIENLPPGFRAKKVYRMLSADQIVAGAGQSIVFWGEVPAIQKVRMSNWGRL